MSEDPLYPRDVPSEEQHRAWLSDRFFYLDLGLRKSAILMKFIDEFIRTGELNINLIDQFENEETKKQAGFAHPGEI